jgi:hypothetical protein
VTVDKVVQSIAEQQQWRSAPGVLGATLESLPPEPLASTGISPPAMQELATRASDPQNPHRESDYKLLVGHLARLPEQHFLAMGRIWMRTDCVFLHLLIPDALRACERPSAAFGEEVLAWGVRYPDPSLNREFVDAALGCLGRDAVVGFLLDELRGVGAAYYWLRGREQPALAERRLKKQLRPVASYLKPWWRPW